MKIRNAVTVSAILLSALAGLPSPVEAGAPPGLPNLAPVFPFRNGSFDNNFVVTNRDMIPTLEFEILTANIGGQDWVRPPKNRNATCSSSTQYFVMPQTHQYIVYWFDPDQQQYVPISFQRKNTICIQDDAVRGNDPQLNCLQQHGTNFPCGCNSTLYGPGTGNGVSQGWADSYFRNLPGQWARLYDYTGDFVLTVELDPDQLLQPSLAPCLDDSDCFDPDFMRADTLCRDGQCNMLDRERDLTHDDNISYVYFHYDGGFGSVDPVTVVYNFAPVCTP